MPYQSTDDLPESVRNPLPMHAQEIFRAAFNSAWNEYGQDEPRAFRVAWSAVERQYRKEHASGKWVKKD